MSKVLGFSLLDIIVSIAIIATIAVAAGMLVAAGTIRSASRDRLRATLLAENVLEAARAASPGLITERVNGPPVGAVFPWGDFEVQALSGAPSAPSVLAVIATGTAISGTTSALPLPGDARSDFDLAFSVRVPPGSASGWRAGTLVRALDLQNAYRFTLGASTALFEKIQNGAVTTLASKNISSTLGTWYTLRVVARGENFDLYRNGSLLETVTDNTLAAGGIALAGTASALPSFDSISIAGAGSWFFESDPAGSIPASWHRLGPADLPAGSVDLSVTPTFPGSSLKTLISTVRWQSTRGAQSVSITTYHP